jgi:hypothetical protein
MPRILGMMKMNLLQIHFIQIKSRRDLSSVFRQSVKNFYKFIFHIEENTTQNGTV